MGYSPWGCKDSNMTERTHTHPHTHIHPDSNPHSLPAVKKRSQMTRGVPDFMLMPFVFFLCFRSSWPQGSKR